MYKEKSFYVTLSTGYIVSAVGGDFFVISIIVIESFIQTILFKNHILIQKLNKLLFWVSK